MKYRIKTTEINNTTSWFSDKNNKIDKLLLTLNIKKRDKTKIIKSEIKEGTLQQTETDSTEIKKTRRKY